MFMKEPPAIAEADFWVVKRQQTVLVEGKEIPLGLE